MKYDVFISYSSKDQKVAEGICGYLERYGLRCFVAYRDIPKSKMWAAVISSSIVDSAMMVAVFSQNFNISKETDREIGIASKNDKAILTYRITDDPFSDTKEYYLGNLNWIDAFPNPQENFGELYDNVCKLLGKTSSTTVVPQPLPESKQKPSSLKACQNKYCKNFGKYILPSEARFCPECGNSLSVLPEAENERRAREEAARFKDRIFTVNGVSFEMVAVKGGTFTMGATSEQGSDAYNCERPTHSVTLDDYYIGKFEVTQELWEAVMGSNPSSFKGSKLPVEQVSWYEAVEFCNRLSEERGRSPYYSIEKSRKDPNNKNEDDALKWTVRVNPNADGFRLPTEAEWEYAARGGNRSKHYKYSGSSSINDVAWYNGNSGSETHAVGTKSPNELGIYDMSSNVWEWCHDWYGSYGSGSQTNPQGPSSGSHRVLRGGSWNDSARNCRVSLRYNFAPDFRIINGGFRLVLVP